MTFNLINQNTESDSFGYAKTANNGVNAIKNAVFYKCECPTAVSGRSKRKLGGALLCLPCAKLRGF